ncbi:flap endonuclease-1 [Halocatena halophila]|uniref:flap endonuclease-1 n=1 Tax=Halocatena halophila TaxID=2814576 RepID=UPI002ED085C5
MGNAAFREIATIEAVSFDELSGVVAVDAHNWLYRYLTTTVRFTSSDVYTTEDGTEVANLVGVVQGLGKFFENDLVPVFVFDGGVTELKAEEVDDRREQRETYEQQLEDEREDADATRIAQLESRTQRLTDVIHETTRELLDHLDVPVVEAPAEGEAQAAHMARNGGVDYVGSEDYDTLLLGAPVTLRKLTSSGNLERMDFQATLEAHDLTWEQLVDVGILCGTDFNDGVDGIGPKTAVKKIHEHGDLWSVLEAEDAYVDRGDAIRSLFLNPDVTDDYSVDTDVSPDIDAARDYLTEWEIPHSAVERGLERIEDATAQTGLDEFF